MTIAVTVAVTLAVLGVVSLAHLGAAAEAESCACPYSCAVHDPDSIIVSEEVQ